jgi:hypothetical protein
MNELIRLMNSPIVIYVLLGFYGVLLFFLFSYVRNKFQKSAVLLEALKQEWDSADSRHAGFVGHAQAQITRLAAHPKQNAEVGNQERVNRDIRNQVVTMGKKGISTADIARSCGLPEGEVDVLLGLARMQVNSR